MNKHDRKELHAAIETIREANNVILSLGEAEETKYDNMPESLQGSDRGETFEQNAEALNELYNEIDGALDSLEVN